LHAGCFLPPLPARTVLVLVVDSVLLLRCRAHGCYLYAFAPLLRTFTLIAFTFVHFCCAPFFGLTHCARVRTCRCVLRGLLPRVRVTAATHCVCGLPVRVCTARCVTVPAHRYDATFPYRLQLHVVISHLCGSTRCRCTRTRFTFYLPDSTTVDVLARLYLLQLVVVLFAVCRFAFVPFLYRALLLCTGSAHRVHTTVPPIPCAYSWLLHYGCSRRFRLFVLL